MQFMAPGIMCMTILFTSTFSGMALLWDREFGFLKETLVAPVPRLTVMIGRTVGGATVALCQGLLIFLVSLIAGFRPAGLFVVPLAILFMALVALVFSAMGTIIGSTLKEMQGFQLIMNFLVMPIYFLSGALFPLAGLPIVLKVMTRIDPLSYGIDAMRNLLLGTSEFTLVLSLAVLCVASVIFIALGSYSFSKIQI
jgi:ABC-2 type transport system permease protein